MSTKLQQLGIDRWPVADRLALMDELQATLPSGSAWRGDPPQRLSSGQHRRADDDDGRPWSDTHTDLGGEG
jgi:hypothetical protein